ncbi:hypothetical protein [uncultured Winogradskyella sp.]|uniref:hypothetical protein n=1 Tax=uncultured Winogradskyella sp. TaxID=395353 RepID=UPI00260E64FD|nr:hypothetical protein [uncultured Winogradskyella sp.]
MGKYLIFIIYFTLFVYTSFQEVYGQSTLVLYENFENGSLSNWNISSANNVKVIDSYDKSHNKVLELKANGKVFALLKKSKKINRLKVEGEMFFPKKIHNYLGFIYNYQKRGKRDDFGVLYVKGNGSYIRANPWRDGNVSRLLYEEYKISLKGKDSIKIGEWHRFKFEVVNEVIHLYINNLKIPKIIFPLFELSSGMVGFQPRVSGGSVWLDNIKLSKIDNFSYKGESTPKIDYSPEDLVTNWEVAGPFSKPNQLIENGIKESKIKWRKFNTDLRGGVITGRVTEYDNENTVAYFKTNIVSDSEKEIILNFSTIDELTLFLNKRFIGRIYRDAYRSPGNDWNAWFDFYNNPKHKGRVYRAQLKKGVNELIIKVRNGQFASGGFFLKLDK